MSGENIYGFTAAGLGYKLGEQVGQYVHKLDSVANATPKNEPLFDSTITGYTALGVATNTIHENAPKIKAVVKTVANDICDGAKGAYDWMAEHSLVGQVFGKETVDNVNKFVLGGGLIGLGYRLINDEK